MGTREDEKAKQYKLIIIWPGCTKTLDGHFMEQRKEKVIKTKKRREIDINQASTFFRRIKNREMPLPSFALLPASADGARGGSGGPVFLKKSARELVSVSLLGVVADCGGVP